MRIVKLDHRRFSPTCPSDEVDLVLPLPCGARFLGDVARH